MLGRSVFMRVVSMGFLWGDREMAILDQIDDRLPLPEFTQGLEFTLGELFGWLVDEQLIV